MASEPEEAQKTRRLPAIDQLSRGSMVALPETGFTEELKQATSADHRRYEVIYVYRKHDIYFTAHSNNN